jgi:hypothetical protein
MASFDLPLIRGKRYSDAGDLQRRIPPANRPDKHSPKTSPSIILMFSRTLE